MESFKGWLLGEAGDIFGFGGRRRASKAPVERCDKPITGVSSDLVVEFMMSRPVEGRLPVSEFSNQIRWGEGTGSVQMVVSPFGSYKSIIRRRQPDLEGREVWACKRVVPYKEILDADLKIDEELGWELLKEVENVRRQEVEAPARDWGGLSRLASKASRCLQRDGVKPEIFVYRGVREAKKDLNYLIVFEVRGQGVEAPGSSRVEEFIVDMSYDPSTGMVRCFGHDVQSPTKGHLWYPMPSEWDEKFSSGQDEDEILTCIGGALRSY